MAISVMLARMWDQPTESPYLLPFDEAISVDQFSTAPPKDVPSGKAGKKEHRKALRKEVEALHELQRNLQAEDSQALLLVFQAMDAAGKDSTIRNVLSGVNPAGVRVAAFKKPSETELDHDFLWRVHKETPARGMIGVFNRSHYEEVLVVRVNQKILEYQRLPEIRDSVFEERYESIVDFEKHLARNGTRILKFFLNVSKDAQKARFLDRIDEEDKNWKFSAGDLDVRDQWEDYMSAYGEAFTHTHRPWAPWYAIPADDKPFMRRTVAEIVRRTLEAMNPQPPELSKQEKSELKKHRKRLTDE